LIDGEKREPERRGVESIASYSCEMLTVHGGLL
jgi:hypothetical protein